MANEMEALERIVEAFERSDWHEIDIRWADLRVHLSTERSVREVPAKTPTDEPTGVPEEPAPREPDSDAVELHQITAPSPGIYWRAPEPGAPPFVEVGTIVSPTDTLCIIEVMKLMNHVKAGVSGRIVDVMIEDGTAVSMGEVLFAVSLDSTGSSP